jgi:hypothetical protein
MATAAIALIVLLRGASRWFFLPMMFDDWIFSRTYFRPR